MIVHSGLDSTLSQVKCNPGMYPVNESSCAPCPSGTGLILELVHATFRSAVTLLRCTGTFQPDSGRAACLDCLAGEVSSSRRVCIVCGAGNYFSNGACIACQLGTSRQAQVSLQQAISFAESTCF